MNKVQLEFWMSSLDPISLRFIQEFKKLRKEFETSVSFKPRFVLIDCDICKQSGYINVNNPGCVSGGRYCAPQGTNFVRINRK